MPGAVDDLKEAADYIAHDSPHHAGRLVEKILDATDRLAVFPRSGRVVPEFNNDACREIIVGNYRVLYDVFDEHVEIIAVHHGARLLEDRP